MGSGNWRMRESLAKLWVRLGRWCAKMLLGKLVELCSKVKLLIWQKHMIVLGSQGGGKIFLISVRAGNRKGRDNAGAKN